MGTRVALLASFVAAVIVAALVIGGDLGNSALAQGRGAPPAGRGGGGIGQVIERLDAIDARLDGFDARLASLETGITGLAQDHTAMTETLGRIEEEVTPGLLNTSASVCFAVDGALIDWKAGLETESKATGRGGLGVDFYGNQVNGEVNFESKATGEIKHGLAAGIGGEVCLEGPGHSLGSPLVSTAAPSVAAPQPVDLLAASLGDLEQRFAGELVDRLAGLGLDPGAVADDLRAVVAAVSALQPPENPFDIVDPESEFRRAVRAIVEAAPVPERVRERLTGLQDLLPQSAAELNLCADDFRWEIPAGRAGDLVDDLCGKADRVLDLMGVEPPLTLDGMFDTGVSRLEEIMLLRDQLKVALDSIVRMEEAIFELAEGIDLPTPPSRPGSGASGEHQACNLLPPRLRPPICK